MKLLGYIALIDYLKQQIDTDFKLKVYFKVFTHHENRLILLLNIFIFPFPTNVSLLLVFKLS